MCGCAAYLEILHLPLSMQQGNVSRRCMISFVLWYDWAPCASTLGRLTKLSSSLSSHAFGGWAKTYDMQNVQHFLRKAQLHISSKYLRPARRKEASVSIPALPSCCGCVVVLSDLARVGGVERDVGSVARRLAGRLGKPTLSHRARQRNARTSSRCPCSTTSALARQLYAR
eukprot:2614926-Pleurochrysis_carterae.AAC.3